MHLGKQTFDVSTRTLVLLSLQPGDSFDPAQVAPAARPHLLELDALELTSDDVLARAFKSLREWSTQMQAFDGCTVVRTSRLDVADAALQRGAPIAHNDDGLADPAYLRVIKK